MKIIKHALTSVLPLAALAVMLLAGCAKNKIQQAVDDLNEKCPIALGQFIRMMGATYEGDRIAVRYVMDERLMKIESFQSNDDLMKKQLLSLYGHPTKDLKNFVDVILDAQATLEFVYEGSLSGKKFSVVIKPEELKQAQQASPLTLEESLDIVVQITNAQAPMMVAEGITMTAMTKEGDGVYYIYEVSDDTLFANLQGNIEQNKAMIRQALESLSEVEKVDLRKIPAAGKFLGYRYVNTSTGQQVEITFTISQLDDMLR